MSEKKVITKEIAEKFLADPIPLDSLTEFSSIEDTAAESLSKHEGYLQLNGLTELSDAAAESLSKHQGDLNLSGLTELSDAAAASRSPAIFSAFMARVRFAASSSSSPFCGSRSSSSLMM